MRTLRRPYKDLEKALQRPQRHRLDQEGVKRSLQTRRESKGPSPTAFCAVHKKEFPFGNELLGAFYNARLKALLKVLIRLLKARLKVLLKVLIRLLKARLKVLLKVLIRLLKALLKLLLKVLIWLLKARLTVP